jgi:putative transposase
VAAAVRLSAHPPALPTSTAARCSTDRFRGPGSAEEFSRKSSPTIEGAGALDKFTVNPCSVCHDGRPNKELTMKPDEKKKWEEAIALFRHRLIADFIHSPPPPGKLTERLNEIAGKTYEIPYSTRTCVAVDTLRDWIKMYKSGAGFDALKPNPRRDTGVSHALPSAVADALCAIKEANKKFSIPLVIRQARVDGRIPPELNVAHSTVRRLFQRSGLMVRSPSTGSDHRRFSFPNANDLWMSDVMHGPTVGVGGKKRRKSYMITLFDDATRVVCYSAFALSENTAAFIPTLKDAVLRRGIPKRLFVDNGSAYRSHHLQIVCAKLGITLIHARPYHPEAKGKIERYHRTVRGQFLVRIKPADTESLEALNRCLWHYIESEYHETPHYGLDDKQTPLQAWALRACHVQHLGARPDIDDLFLFEQRRRVRKDRTVSLDAIHYEVEADFVGQSVTLRYDPTRPGTVVQVWHNHKRAADARPVDVHANCFVKRMAPTPIISNTISYSHLARAQNLNKGN